MTRREDHVRHVGPALCLLLFASNAVAAAAPDPLPVIVTYELRKQRQDERLVARNPQAFWVKQIMARLEARKPALPVPLKQTVTVRVSFVVGHDGHLVSKVLSQSSGNDVADKTAMEMIAKAQPFPPMPAGMHDSEMTFTLPVRFR